MGNLAAVNYDQPLRYYRRGKQSDSEFKKKFTDNFDVEKHINSIVSSVDTNGVMKEINNYRSNLRYYIIYLVFVIFFTYYAYNYIIFFLFCNTLLYILNKF